MEFEVSTLNERPYLKPSVSSLDNRSWPLFLQNGDARSWFELYGNLADFVTVLTADDELIAVGFAVPIFWNGHIADLPASIEMILRRGVRAKKSGESINTLVPVGVIVEPTVQKNGMSRAVLLEMKQLASNLGLSSMIVPVRPFQKNLFPSEPISIYADRKNEHGLLYDPWLRVHERLGARIIHVTENTLTVEGDLESWFSWTGKRFHHSGLYDVPGALSLVDVQKEINIATYRDPNVWMSHPL